MKPPTCTRAKLFFALLAVLALAALPVGAQTPSRQSGITYEIVNGQIEKLDVFGAELGARKAAVLVVHGGGWAGGDRDNMTPFAMALAQNGFVAVTIDYRLAGPNSNKHPAQWDDCQRAVRWLRAHAADYGIDPGKIGALGISAGGHLVALLGTTDTRDNSDATLAAYSSRVECVVDVCGPTNLASGAEELHETAAQGAATLRNFIGAGPLEAAAKYKEASPLSHVDTKSAPFLIFHGVKDSVVPVQQSKQLDAALKAAGVESQLIIDPEGVHGWGNQTQMTQNMDLAIQFLKRHLNK